jgi:hypothetical protein
MKKQEMIKCLQSKEADLFLKVKESEMLYGDDSPLTKRDRAGWSVIHEIMETMGIKPDDTLPSAKKAFEIIIGKVT